MPRTPLTFTLCLSLALLFSVSTASASEHPSPLSQYHDGSEMNARIISEFLSSPLYKSEGGRWSASEISQEFEVYRAAWVERMINFVISELNVDPETAKRVRLNPSNYMVNYETFKLLSFK
jgi:hypothetical protein